MDSHGELYGIADELRAIANLGLAFCKNDYDRERYEHVLAASARIVAALDGRSHDQVLAVYRDNLEHFSPLVGAEAAVFRDDRILLIQRADNGLWAMPGGLLDVGETVAEGAVRELWEAGRLTDHTILAADRVDRRQGPWLGTNQVVLDSRKRIPDSGILTRLRARAPVRRDVSGTHCRSAAERFEALRVDGRSRYRRRRVKLPQPSERWVGIGGARPGKRASNPA